MTGRIRIDGQSIPFAEGQTVMQAAEDSGVHIPHLCYHADYEANGSCKMCTCKINGKAGLTCQVPVSGDVTLDPISLSRVQKDLVCETKRKGA